MDIRTVDHPCIPTRDVTGSENGFLVPIYNVHDGHFPSGDEPQQVYLTTIAPGSQKGPHLHYVRRGWFTCIKGDIRITVRVDGRYEHYYSGESHGYRSVEIPRGVPALLENIGPEMAFVLNMPAPAWTPDMHDEHSADFGDLDG